MEIKKYKKKPVVIEAMKLEYNVNSIDAVCEWIGESATKWRDGNVIIKTLEGDMMASSGDYIIKGIGGEFYPCKPDIFDKTYEEVKQQ